MIFGSVGIDSIIEYLFSIVTPVIVSSSWDAVSRFSMSLGRIKDKEDLREPSTPAADLGRLKTGSIATQNF